MTARYCSLSKMPGVIVMSLNSAGSPPFLTICLPFLYHTYLHLYNYHMRHRAYTIAEQEQDKRAGGFIRRPGMLAPSRPLSPTAISRLPKRWYLCFRLSCRTVSVSKLDPESPILALP